MASTDTYMEPKVFRYPDAVVRVYRPELTPEERARRMKSIYRHAANLLKSAKS